MNKQVSASNVEAFVMCTTSHVISQHDAYLDRTVAGTAMHAELGRMYKGQHWGSIHPKVLKEVPAEVDYSVEPAYVVNVKERTSTFLGYDIGRDYAGKLGRPLSEYEMGVSLDIADRWTSPNNRDEVTHFIRDWKGGRHSSWWQLYIQAMAVLWAYGGSEVDAGFVHILTDEDADDPIVYADTATLYLMDLEERADEVVKAFDLAKKLEADLASGKPASDLRTVEGKWCEYCGAYPHCPSKWKLAKAMLDLDVTGHIEALTPSQCGAAWLRLKEIKKKLVERTEDALKGRLAVEGSFPLPNGKRLKMVEVQGRDSFDKAAANTLLRRLGATQEDINSLFVQGRPYTRVTEVK